MKRLHGYLATLDVLGFSDMLQRDGYSTVLMNYMTCVNEVIRPAHTDVECVVFSDSIVLTSKGVNDAAFENIVRACSAAFYALLKNEIPVRGAIAFGTYWREHRAGSVFLAGRPIVEAYRCERDSDWVGILLCTSVLLHRESLSDDTLIHTADDDDEVTLEQLKELHAHSATAFRLQPAKVPMRDETNGRVDDFAGYAIVPMEADGDGSTAARNVQTAKNALWDLRFKASRPKAQAKYQASMAFLDEVQPQLESVAKLYRRARKAKLKALERL